MQQADVIGKETFYKSSNGVVFLGYRKKKGSKCIPSVIWPGSTTRELLQRGSLCIETQARSKVSLFAREAMISYCGFVAQEGMPSNQRQPSCGDQKGGRLNGKDSDDAQ